MRFVKEGTVEAVSGHRIAECAVPSVVETERGERDSSNSTSVRLEGYV